MSESSPKSQSARNELRAKLIDDLALLVYLSLRRDASQPRAGNQPVSGVPQQAAETQEER